MYCGFSVLDVLDASRFGEDQFSGEQRRQDSFGQSSQEVRLDTDKFDSGGLRQPRNKEM